MDDLISRKAAIDALGEEPEVWEDVYTASDEYSIGLRNQWRFDKNAIEALPSAQPEQRWIPVTERLPEKDGKYWVTNTQGQAVIYVFDSTGNSEEYWGRCVIAWMPYCRPEPYREKTT